jgi:hypothetical protein
MRSCFIDVWVDSISQPSADDDHPGSLLSRNRNEQMDNKNNAEYVGPVNLAKTAHQTGYSHGNWGDVDAEIRFKFIGGSFCVQI